MGKNRKLVCGGNTIVVGTTSYTATSSFRLRSWCLTNLARVRCPRIGKRARPARPFALRLSGAVAAIATATTTATTVAIAAILHVSTKILYLRPKLYKDCTQEPSVNAKVTAQAPQNVPQRCRAGWTAFDITPLAERGSMFVRGLHHTSERMREGDTEEGGGGGGSVV